MNNWKMKLLSLFAALAFCAGLASAQQFSYVNTTLSTALGYTASGNQNLVQLASVTGLVAQTTATGAPGNGSVIYIDRELMQVNQINVAANTVTVTRGILGTQASAHISGSQVIGGFSWWFNDYDAAGACTLAQTVVSPWINTRTGQSWNCSALVGEWVPFIGNPGAGGVPVEPSAAVASAGTITPTGQLFHVTGTTPIVTFTAPSGFQGGGTMTIVFDAIETWTAAGNIGVAGTNTTAGTTVTFTFDRVTGKWYPSRAA